VETLIVTTPLLFTVPDPMELPPSSSCTTPSTTGELPLVTMAVKVNVSPEVALAEDEVSVVAVAATTGAAGATVTRTAFETEAARLEVPPKLASIESEPLGKVDRLIVATPPLTVPVPMRDPLEKRVTTPEFAGLTPLDTVAVKITLEP
jgi:hypothetical protein